ncbi:ArnT family glycosyltransferase [Gimesia aquarii]|uniref:ArnT family glycosyltransferase n=1 Tax=Gimesia aquarii TaxID=2527964 RepID=UPI0018D8E903|nr:glycosyltransferase family 39 protein [Gimesia aquarii]
MLIAHSFFVVGAAWSYSPTVDEVSHLVAGLSHWRFSRFDLYRVNPPLVHLVAAFPLLFLDDVKEDWSPYSTTKTERREFACGRKFLDANKTRAIQLYRIGRLACLPFTLLGATAIFFLGRQIFDSYAGLLSMSLWCFSPNIIGNAAIITPDIPAAALSILAALTFWQWLIKPVLNTSLIAGVTLGFALSAKGTCIILPVAWLIIWVSTLANSFNANRKRSKEAWQLASIFIVAIIVLNLMYAFDGSFQQLGNFDFVSKSLRGSNESVLPPGNRFKNQLLGIIPIPLPADYIHGIDLQKADFEKPRWSYVNNHQQLGGWWWWYYYALAVKVPLGTILLFFMAIVFTQYRIVDRNKIPATWCVFVPAILIAILVMSQTAFSRYLRYLLPAFPFVYVWIGCVLHSNLARRRWWIACVILCCLGNLYACIRIYPHYLAYFNEVSGGPQNGHWHLLDANVDWGQASLELKNWIDKNNHEDVYVSLFAEMYCMRPSDMGISARPLPLEYDQIKKMYVSKPIDKLPSGLYAISVNHLHGYRHHLVDIDCSAFLDLKPVTSIGHAIKIYYLPPAKE